MSDQAAEEQPHGADATALYQVQFIIDAPGFINPRTYHWSGRVSTFEQAWGAALKAMRARLGRNVTVLSYGSAQRVPGTEESGAAPEAHTPEAAEESEDSR